jgi:hypothetical protein
MSSVCSGIFITHWGYRKWNIWLVHNSYIRCGVASKITTITTQQVISNWYLIIRNNLLSHFLNVPEFILIVNIPIRNSTFQDLDSDTDHISWTETMVIVAQFTVGRSSRFRSNAKKICLSIYDKNIQLNIEK